MLGLGLAVLLCIATSSAIDDPSPGVHPEDARDLTIMLEEAKFDRMLLEQRVDDLTSHLETYSNDLKGGNSIQTAPIGFTAAITKSITYFNPSTCIVYDCIVTNIGDAYNHRSGMFTAPVHGIYNFFVKTMVESSHTLNMDMVVNGNRIVSVETYGRSGGYGSGSASAVTVLNPGDQVFIKPRQNHASHLWGNNWNTFSGYLVKAM